MAHPAEGCQALSNSASSLQWSSRSQPRQTQLDQSRNPHCAHVSNPRHTHPILVLVLLLRYKGLTASVSTRICRYQDRYQEEQSNAQDDGRVEEGTREARVPPRSARDTLPAPDAVDDGPRDRERRLTRRDLGADSLDEARRGRSCDPRLGARNSSRHRCARHKGPLVPLNSSRTLLL